MRYFQTGGSAGTTGGSTANKTGESSSLATWAGDYVGEMLGRGEALSNMPYEGYTGELTAGPSALQNQAFSGLAGLPVPDDSMGGFKSTSFTGMGYTMPDAAALAGGANIPAGAPTNVVQQYMNPFLQNALQPQIEAARREHEIDRMAQAARFGKAEAYGGSRQAVTEGEMGRGLRDRLSGIVGTGYETAYEQARTQFNKEQQQQRLDQEMANKYGFDVFGAQGDAGAVQRAIDAEGIKADRAQFALEREYPYKNVQYMQSLLEGLPLETQDYKYYEPSGLANLEGGLSDATGILEMLADLFGLEETPTNGGSGHVPFDWNAYDTYVESNLLGNMTQADAEAAARVSMGLT